MRAFARDVTVGKELVCLFVIILFGSFFDEFTLVIKFFEELGGKFMVSFRRGSAVYIERDAEFFERLLDEGVVTVYYILRSDSFFLGTDGNGHTVFIGTSDEEYVFFLQSQVTDVDICRYVYTGKMPDMDRAVGIRESRGYCGSFKLLFHVI